MTIDHLIVFNIALLTAIASPGPALLIAVRTALGSGRRAAIAVGAGLGLVAAAWTLAALLGLEAVFRLFPTLYAAAKLLGALYLLYLAWAIWRGAGDAVTTARRPARRAFREGVLINLLNPKSVLFAAAVLVVIFPPGLSGAAKAAVVLNHLVVELLFYTVLALTMTTPAVSRRYLGAKVVLDRAAAAVLGALGLRLLLDR